MILVIRFMPTHNNAIIALGLHILVGAAVYILLAGLYIIKVEKFAIVHVKKKK